MTATHAPMPPVDPAALHCAPVDHAPILPSLAWQIAADLWPDVDSVEVSKSPDLGRANVIARAQGLTVCADLFFVEGDRLVASTGGEHYNAPDHGSIAGLMLARLRGDR